MSNAQNVTNGSRTKTRFAVGLKKKRPTMTTTPAVVEASVADEARAATILAEYADALAIVVRDTPERGLCELYLDTHDGLLAAIRFYERRGYVRIERYNDNPQATVFMRRAIC